MLYALSEATKLMTAKVIEFGIKNNKTSISSILLSDTKTRQDLNVNTIVPFLYKTRAVTSYC